eukprot:3137507-Amphidinium_carterae.2
MEAHTHVVVSTPGGNSNKAIGMIQWIAPQRPDILYALKEGARTPIGSAKTFRSAFPAATQ